MNIYFKNGGVLIVVALLTVLAYLLGTCGVTMTCGYYSILNPYALDVLEPLFYFSLTLIPLAVVLLFVPRPVLKGQTGFTLFWLSLSVVLIAITPRTSTTWITLYPELTKESMAVLLAMLFTAISLIRVARSNR